LALNYIAKDNSYTALSTDTDAIAALVAQFTSGDSHGIKLFLTDTGEHKIFDFSTGVKTFIPDKSYNTPITMSHSVAIADVAYGVALAANPNRKYALIINDSDTTIYIAIGTSAILNTGIRLNANGGSFEMTAKHGNLDVRVINCICSVATKKLIITEGV